MSRDAQSVAPASRVNRPGTAIAVVLGPCVDDVCALHLQGPLRAPVPRELRHGVRDLLARGARAIVVDLARVPRIDAAGVGELVRAYNTTTGANAGLRIVHATVWVREILERVRLFDLLSAEWERE
jgi:anti-anti-sigma factor